MGLLFVSSSSLLEFCSESLGNGRLRVSRKKEEFSIPLLSGHTNSSAGREAEGGERGFGIPEKPFLLFFGNNGTLLEAGINGFPQNEIY